MREILNSGQLDAAKKMSAFLSANNTKGTHFTLTGGPGTGKTFLVKHVIGRHQNMRIVGTAISHAATSVLQDSLDRNIKCYTVASLLGFTMDENAAGEIKFTINKKSKEKLRGVDAVILDEASMIDDDTYDYLMGRAYELDVKIIAIGDKYQLPPVEQDHDSKFFTQIDAELTQPMRFVGPIQTLSEAFRDEITKISDGDAFDKYILNAFTNRQDHYVDSIKSGYRFASDIDVIMGQAAEEFNNNTKNPNYARILAFKNESVDTINDGIRQLRYGSNLSQFEPGELIIANGGYTVRVKDFAGRVTSIPLIHNGQILIIDDYIVDKGPAGIPCAKLNIRDSDINQVNYPVYAISKEHGTKPFEMYKKEVARLKTAALLKREAWSDYYGFVGQFLWYNYAYSVNLYRAQGTTLKNVYVFDGEVMDVKPLTWKQKFQALYVAMTRASNNLTFYNKNY